MSDIIVALVVFYVFYGIFFGFWYLVEATNNNKQINWKAFPIYFLLGAPGFIILAVIFAVAFLIDWIISHWPKNMRPFK